MWREDVVEHPEPPPRKRTPIDIDALQDGRCKASTWRKATMPKKPDYENHFGPGGYNRCIGSSGHVNWLHKDEWGHVFTVDDEGHVRVVRTEMVE